MPLRLGIIVRLQTLSVIRSRTLPLVRSRGPRFAQAVGARRWDRNGCGTPRIPGWAALPGQGRCGLHAALTAGRPGFQELPQPPRHSWGVPALAATQVHHRVEVPRPCRVPDAARGCRLCGGTPKRWLNLGRNCLHPVGFQNASRCRITVLKGAGRALIIEDHLGRSTQAGALSNGFGVQGDGSAATLYQGLHQQEVIVGVLLLAEEGVGVPAPFAARPCRSSGLPSWVIPQGAFAASAARA